MASTTARRPGTSIARSGSGGTRTVIVQRAAAGLRKVGSAAAQKVKDRKHKLWALGAAGALGYGQREGMLDSIPHIDALGVDGTLAALAWVGAEFTGNKTLDHISTGLGCVAINRLARGE